MRRILTRSNPTIPLSLTEITLVSHRYTMDDGVIIHKEKAMTVSLSNCEVENKVNVDSVIFSDLAVPVSV